MNRLTEVYALGTEDSAASGASGGGAGGASTSASSSSSMTFTVSDVSALEHARGQILNRLAPDAHDLLDRATCPVLKPKCKQALSPLAVTASPMGSSSSGAGSGVSTSSTGGTTETATLELKALYLYDPMNRRVVRWVLGEATHYYAYDGWQEVQEYAPGAAVEMTQFVWGEQLDELVAFRTSPGVGVWSNYYVAEGGAHCPSRVLNEAGGVVEVQEYDPYGATTYYSGGVGYGRSQVGNPFGWKAVRVDAETGLLYMRNRYYHVGWGRFLTQDPLGVGGDPVTWLNAYSYGSANPLVQVDPLGLQVVAFMGGFGDQGFPGHTDLIGRASREHKVVKGVSKVFGWTEVREAADWIEKAYRDQASSDEANRKRLLNGFIKKVTGVDGWFSEQPPVVVIGHSWGGAQAADVATLLGRRGIQVGHLITLDPVSEGWVMRPPCGKWINVYQKQTIADMPASIPVVGNVVSGFLGFANILIGGSFADAVATLGGQLGTQGAADINFASDLDHADAPGQLKEALRLAPELLGGRVFR